jgi:hypothetical protein
MTKTKQRKLPSKRQRKPKFKLTPKRSIAKQPIFRSITAHGSRYITSLYRDILTTGLELPSTNYFGPYDKFTVTGRTAINLANTANLHGGIIVNPMLMFMQSFYGQKSSAGADVTFEVPTVYQHATTSTNTGCPSNLVAGGITSVLFNSRLNNTTAAALRAKVRCLGVHFKIYYTGTWNNRGGTIVAYTNPTGVALATCAEPYPANQQPVSAFQSLASADLAGLPEITSVHHLDEEFSFTWRPSTLDFMDVDGYVPDESPVPAASTSGNPALRPYLSFDGAPAATTPAGWITGFEIRPAAGTQGTVSNYYCEIMADFDLQTTLSGQSYSGITYNASNRTTLSDPNTASAVHNALSDLHVSRRSIALKPNASSLAVAPNNNNVSLLGKFERLAIKSGKAALTDIFGSRLGAMLA